VNLPCLGKWVLLLSYFPKGLFVNDALFEEDGDLQKRNQQLKDKEIEELKSINKRFFLVIIFSGLLIIILLSILIFIAFRQRHLVKEMVISKELNSSLNQAILTKDLERSAQNVHFSKLNNLWEVKNSAPVLAKNIGTHLGPMDLMKSEFEYRITGGKGDFYKMLLAEYPDLRPSELKLCSYLRLNLSSKELAELLNKSGRTIENTRFSIRKKMGLKPEDNLVTHLIDLENKLSNKS
jgi:DNA-binding CsgD family transcriptional regulator